MKTVNYKIGQIIKIKDTVDFTVTDGIVTGAAIVKKSGVSFYPVVILSSIGAIPYNVRTVVNIPLNSWKLKVTAK